MFLAVIVLFIFAIKENDETRWAIYYTGLILAIAIRNGASYVVERLLDE
jgi:hypothetical protein